MAISDSQRTKVKYSIFLPVKNGEEYIAAAIESILAQQLTDFILIVLENKSTDNTLSIVRSYDDPRITVVEAFDELGIYENWSRVFDLIQRGLIFTEFSTIIGHDDIFYPTFLRNIEDLISTYPEASLYQTHFDLIDEVGRIRRPCKPIPTREYAKDFFSARCWGIRDSFGTGYVFRTTDYIKVGGIPNLPLLLWSDDLLIINLTKLSYKVCGGQSSFAYRLHNKSASSRVSANMLIAFANAANNYFIEIEYNHAELICYDRDKVALGYLMSRKIALFDFPFRSFFLGEKTVKTITKIETVGKLLMPFNTVDGISEATLLDRIWSQLRKYYFALKLLRQIRSL